MDFTQKKGTEHNKKGKRQARARDRTGDLAQKCWGWTLSANHTTRPPGLLYEMDVDFCNPIHKQLIIEASIVKMHVRTGEAYWESLNGYLVWMLRPLIDSYRWTSITTYSWPRSTAVNLTRGPRNLGTLGHLVSIQTVGSKAPICRWVNLNTNWLKCWPTRCPLHMDSTSSTSIYIQCSNLKVRVYTYVALSSAWGFYGLQHWKCVA